MSRYIYHEGKCGPCFICGKTMERRYDHFSGLGVPTQQYIQRHHHNTIPGNSCLCRTHSREALRNIGNSEHVPTWSKQSEVAHTESTQMCVYPECNASSSNAKIITVSEATNQAFYDALHTHNTEQPLSLCEAHYQRLYRQIHTHKPCASCGAKPKVRQSAYTRHSPDAIAVSTYLSERTEFPVTLSSTDILCKSCYDMHLAIVLDIEKQDSIRDINSDILLWNTTIQDESTTELTRAVLVTVVFVAKMLLQDKALLLPHVVTVFQRSYPPAETTSSELYLEMGDGSIKFTARWLMTQLIKDLQPYMEYKCVVKRIGTVLYPRNGNLLKTLTLALYKAPEGEIMVSDDHETTSRDNTSVMQEAGSIVNCMIHDEIRKYGDHTPDLTSFDLKASIKNVNPILWDFVCRSTKSVRESIGITHGVEHEHIKNVRRYYIIAMIMFATNASCNIPLHHLIADTIEVYGGSRQLLRIMNRLGVCVSSDTHDRFVTCIAEQQSKASLWSELTPGTFTVATVDNIDFLQSHAAVYSGDQSRSYHGTTIQAIQPVPSVTLSTGICSVPSNIISTPEPSVVCINTISETQANLKTSGLVTSSETVHISRPLQPVAQEASGKRHYSSSPANSPHKHGKTGPKRRRMMQVMSRTKLFAGNADLTPTISHPSLQLEHFKENECEVESKTLLSKQAFAYFVQKFAQQNTELDGILKPLREFIPPTVAQLTDHNPSVIYYMDLLDENADSEETMAEVAEMVTSQITSECQKWVLLVGDGKTYDHLVKVKRLYGTTLKNVLIYPGDWHILKNFQPVLMKAWYHLGLREIAKAAGFRGETLKSLENCSHFKRTHLFLVQVWEALYCEVISSFATTKPEIEAKVMEVIEQHNSGTTSVNLLLTMQEVLSDMSIFSDFSDFLSVRSEADDTWKLWSNFVFNDCFCYVSLFLAIRTSNWDLRMSSLKQMAPLFAAYDRPCYQRLLPRHIGDVLCYPEDIVQCLKAGGFTVKIKGGIGHAVALDEAHEMCINRDMKMAVARPTVPYLKKTTHFFSYRIKSQKQLISQLFPQSTILPQTPTIWDSTSTSKRWNDNVRLMRTTIAEHCVFTTDSDNNRGVVNLFANKQATPEQAHDLLNARTIGEQSYLHFVKYYLLQLPSLNAPIRQKRLLTMAPIKVTKRRITQQQKEQQNTNKYLRRRLAWCNQTGEKYDESAEQYSLLPRSLAEIDGTPHKGNKSKWTEKLQARYVTTQSPPFQSTLEWIPEVAIIDAMFMINVNPLRQHKTLFQYADLLFRQYAAAHFSRGTSEVHFVFDNPMRLEFNPKFCEHKIRYSKSAKKADHSHITFTPNSVIPRPWREYLDCRDCKRSLVEAIGLAYCQRFSLRNGQKLILAGCLSGDTEDLAWEVTAGSIAPKLTEVFKSNAQEADMRVWRHALQSQQQRILVYSPDTDIYNIGMTLVKPGHNYIVQLNLPQHPPRYVSINKLIISFQSDPDLGGLPRAKLASIMQQLYIVTGCDYVSFIVGIGKAAFLNCFFQYAEFISGNGDLSMTHTSSSNQGFLALIRLIGTAYFKKHLATVVSKLDFDTPVQLYNSIVGKNREELWYQKIRGVIPIMSEDERPPTLTSLWRHWKRSCWVKHMWENSPQADQYSGLGPPEQHGWLKEGTEWKIDWEAEEVKQKIQKTLDFLSKGCTCKTGCGTKRCRCKKESRTCGAGCECRGCTNSAIAQQDREKNENEGEEEDEDDEEYDDEEEEEEEDDEQYDEDDEDDHEHIQLEVVTDAYIGGDMLII